MKTKRIYPFVFGIVCLQSHESDDVRNSDGGQEVKSRMDEMEESSYCTGFVRPGNRTRVSGAVV